MWHNICNHIITFCKHSFWYYIAHHAVTKLMNLWKLDHLALFADIKGRSILFSVHRYLLLPICYHSVYKKCKIWSGVGSRWCVARVDKFRQLLQALVHPARQKRHRPQYLLKSRPSAICQIVSTIPTANISCKKTWAPPGSDFNRRVTKWPDLR